MQLPETLTETQRKCVLAYYDHNMSEFHAAKALGCGVKPLRSSLWLAHKKGVNFAPDNFTEHAPAGYGLSHSTVHIVDGEVKQEWQRIKPIVSDADLAQYLSQRIPVSKLELPDKKQCNENLMLEWLVYDSHIGMLAHEAETGNNYDCKIAKHLQIAAGKILFQSFGPIKEAVIVLGGDNQQADNRSGKTEKSGHIVDTDSRYYKMIWAAYETAVSCIEIAAHFAERVRVIVLSGNHDYHSALHLAVQLHAHFRNHDRIIIDTSPERHRFYSWGRQVFMSTHGDVNAKRIGPYALQQAIRRGYASDKDMRLYVRMGHLHKREKRVPELLTEDDGVVIERFPTLAAMEAYSIEGAYTSVRATAARLWHKDHGIFGGREITLGEILERFPYVEPS
jgi:ribosomal protein L31